MLVSMNFRCAVILAAAFAAGVPGLYSGQVAADGVAANVMAPKAVTAAPVFAAPTTIAFERILPPPPAPGSVAGLADLESVLQAQMWRTAEQVAWAKAAEGDKAFNYAEVLGPWFQARNLPVTAALFADLSTDIGALDAAVKRSFARQRPPGVDPRIQPCVRVPASSSYPSGSALQAFVWAGVLGELVPARREALLDRAHRVSWGRLLGGVHFPSDLVAGRLLAAEYLAACARNPDFIPRLEAARRELAAVAPAK